MTPRLKLGAAALVALLGIVLTWRTLGPAPPADARRTASGPAAKAERPLAPMPAEFDTDVTVDTVHSVTASLATRFRASLQEHGAPGVGGSQLDKLIDEVREILPMYLAGDHEAYFDYLRAHGAALEGVTTGEVSEESRAKNIRFWEQTIKGFALQPVSLNDAFVRPRYLGGREVEVTDLGSVMKVQGAGRYGLPQDAEQARLTIYEVVVPLLYERGATKGPVWVGYSLAWVDETAEWLPWRISVYDAADIGVLTCPAY